MTVLGNTGVLTKTGYTFAGWNTVADGSGTAYNASETFAINANITLSAQWTANSYAISANAGANGTINPAGMVPVSSGSSQVFTVTPDAGYRISSILVDGVPVPVMPSYVFTSIIANHTITVGFEPIPPAASVVVQAGSVGGGGPSCGAGGLVGLLLGVVGMLGLRRRRMV